MKLRILNYRAEARHERIQILSNIRDSVSISDYHAFLFDQEGQQSDSNYSNLDVQRHQEEVRDLIQKKGGIVVSLLRPASSQEWFLQLAAPEIARFIRTWIRQGAGSQREILWSAKGESAGYFQVLRDNLQFTAHLEAPEHQIAELGGIIFARNSVGYPIAVEFVVGEGRVCFLPPANNVPSDRIGAAIVKVITAHFSKTADFGLRTSALSLEKLLRVYTKSFHAGQQRSAVDAHTGCSSIFTSNATLGLIEKTNDLLPLFLVIFFSSVS